MTDLAEKLAGKEVGQTELSKLVDGNGTKYLVVGELFGHYMDFVVYEVLADVTNHGTGRAGMEAFDPTSATNESFSTFPKIPFASGSVKWDGCMNVRFDAQDHCMLHFCGPHYRPELDAILDAAWELGMRMEACNWEKRTGLVGQPIYGLGT